MRRNGTNSHVTFCERLVLPRLKDVVQGVMALLGDKSNSEGLDLLTFDFRDAFKQLHVVASERPYLFWSCDGRVLLLQNGVVRRWIWAFGVVPGRGVGDAALKHG